MTMALPVEFIHDGIKVKIKAQVTTMNIISDSGF
jgi:hypothetical protein